MNDSSGGMTDRDTRAEIADVLTKVLHVELGDVTMVDMADYWALPNERAILGDKLADALIAAGLVVPSGLVQDLTAIAAVLELADSRRWRNEIKSLTTWADALSTQDVRRRTR